MAMPVEPAQPVARLRVSFGVNGALSYVSVLDLGRVWERLLRRAQIPVAHTQGYHPHPRMQFASALPVGYSSSCEMVDLFLTKDVVVDQALGQIRSQSPASLEVLEAEPVAVQGPALQGLMREATYAVSLWSACSSEGVTRAIDGLLGRTEIPRTRTKKGAEATYDMRPLVLDIRYEGLAGSRHDLTVRVLCGSSGAGRPDEMIDELELRVERFSIRRTRLIWEGGGTFDR